MVRKKIAIIDDDKKFLDAISIYLNGRGYGVITYASYQSACRGIKDNVDLAVVDVNLIDGNGLSLLDEVFGNYPNIKTIIITGYDELPRRLMSFSKGADDYMKKPLFPAELVARIQRLLYPKVKKDIQDNLYLLNLSLEEEKLYKIFLKANGGLIPNTLFFENGFTKNSLYITLSRLKKKLPKGEQIKSLYGRGYYLTNCATITKQIDN